MLREEADNERVDYRAPKADGRVINNHRKACDICTHETANNKDAIGYHKIYLIREIVEAQS